MITDQRQNGKPWTYADEQAISARLKAQWVADPRAMARDAMVRAENFAPSPTFGEGMPQSLQESKLMLRTVGAGVAELFDRNDRLAAALEDFATSVWSDCRLPLDQRKSLEALYHNAVLPILREQRQHVTAAAPVGSHDAAVVGQDEGGTVDITAGDAARMQAVYDCLISEHGWSSAGLVLSPNVGRKAAAGQALTVRKEFDGIVAGADDLPRAGRIFVVQRSFVAFQIEWGWENGPVTLVPINRDPASTASEVNESVERYVAQLRAHALSAHGKAPAIAAPCDDEQSEGMSP